MNYAQRALNVSMAVQRARTAARRAKAHAIQAWWPLSWVLGAWAWILGAWAGYREGQARALRDRIRAEVAATDMRHRQARRKAHRDQGGR